MNYKFKIDGMDTCPCGNVTWKEYFKFHVHCWKTGLCCKYSGVHIESYPKGHFAKAKEVAQVLANKISREWFTDVEVKTKKYY